MAVYKEMLRGTGSRVTKKAEKLIDELCLGMPLATKKGNTGSEDHGSEKGDLGEAAKPAKTKGASSGTAKQGKTEGGKGEKPIQEEYTQLSLFDL